MWDTKTVNICLQAQGEGQACLDVKEGTLEGSQVHTLKDIHTKT